MSLINNDLRFFQLEDNLIICFSRVGLFKLIYVEEISTSKRQVINKSGDEEEMIKLAFDIAKGWNATT